MYWSKIGFVEAGKIKSVLLLGNNEREGDTERETQVRKGEIRREGRTEEVGGERETHFS